jgi:hypothetical protein
LSGEFDVRNRIKNISAGRASAPIVLKKKKKSERNKINKE